MKNFYNLLYREEEREMNNYCVDNGIAVNILGNTIYNIFIMVISLQIIPWSPLARGILSCKKGSLRSSSDAAQKRWFGSTPEDAEIADRVRRIAEKRGGGCTPSQVALAWLLSKPGVIAPICGINRIE